MSDEKAVTIANYPPGEPAHIEVGDTGSTFCGRPTHRVLVSMPYEKWMRLSDVPEPCDECLREVRAVLNNAR